MIRLVRKPAATTLSGYRIISKKFAANATAPTVSAAAPASYSTGVQLMHWTMGGAVLGCVAFVLLAQNTKVKEAKGRYMFLHKSCGLLAAGLLFPR